MHSSVRSQILPGEQKFSETGTQTAPVEEQNFATLLEMLNTMQVLEDDEEYQNPVDLLFEELAKKKPNSFAGRQYKLYKLAAGCAAQYFEGVQRGSIIVPPCMSSPTSC